MAEALSARDFVKISEAAAVLRVTEQTLRNWDKSGRLRAYRHPVNGYRLYRVAELEAVLQELRTRDRLRELRESQSAGPLRVVRDDDVPPCHWSPSVALDPKHRPQSWDAPATTVRRDWRKYPQEAHVLSADGLRYRRFTPDEIALLQTIDPGVFRGLDLTDRQKIAAVGDAVPPGFSRALFSAILDMHTLERQTSLEICAGIGGLAEGAGTAGFEHVALVEVSDICGQLLRNNRAWSPDVVHVANVRLFDFKSYAGEVGVLAGGPPCQPWSRSGHGRGTSDDRDLLGWLPEVLDVVRPEAFLFENVPGLLADAHREYLTNLVERLRYPGPDLAYGVLVGRFNAADFGVPQRRERVVFAGFRDAGSNAASRYLDAVAARRTHAEAAASSGPDGLERWTTIGEVLGDRPDPGGWRRWLSY